MQLKCLKTCKIMTFQRNKKKWEIVHQQKIFIPVYIIHTPNLSVKRQLNKVTGWVTKLTHALVFFYSYLYGVEKNTNIQKYEVTLSRQHLKYKAQTNLMNYLSIECDNNELN